ncbi:hypothetical protein AAF712_008201 [Marasmius tenuissimus]|uniref:Nephrocystin 3-like N-terminal domain-containing protein n=1 Tax=Marasmius tenuissimus TaxID=585030 RepID=A0ABR2ZUJ2_9AGAR
MAANPLKSLSDAIAGVGASHKAEQQFSRGECLEGTREKALGMIDEWRKAKSLPICWLSGAAGVGKSAIAMTVANSAENDSGLVASFFFFRSDSRRNDPSALVLTIAHGLTRVSKPSLKIAIGKRIADDPTIFEATLEVQFQELVSKPCMGSRRWRDRLREKWEAMIGTRSASNEPTLVIIDGLDECDDDKTQLRVLSTIASSYQQSPSFPLRFLICSRPESWIREGFCKAPLSQLTTHIPLDEAFLPGRDIERYYQHEFNKLREDAANARIEFPVPWPSEDDLESLVIQSSGQFIYAATAVKFIGSPCTNPIAQLHHILTYTPNQRSSESSKFPELDRLYDIILSNSPNCEELLSILAAILILPPHGSSSPEFIEVLLERSKGEVGPTLRFMHSVLNIQGGNVGISVYHTSFADFLHDPSRSGRFYIDEADRRETFAIQWLKMLRKHIDSNPDIVLNPEDNSIRQVIQRLRQGWVGFCFTDRRPSARLLIERDKLLRSILSAFPNQQALLTTMASVILLPSPRYGSKRPEFIALNDLILGSGAISTMKSLEACLLATPELELEAFLLDFLHNPAKDYCLHDYYLNLPQQRDLLAQRWIRALTPNYQLGER